MPRALKREAIPLTIIAGFLGSGKTTVLNRLLHNPEGRRITAIVNDFGSLNIDQEIIAQKHGNQISLANGCVCCSVGDDLTRTLFEVLIASDRPDHIVIEASGVSDPARIAAFASVDRELRLDGIICCIDSLAYERQSSDPRLEDTMRRQIDAAHIFLATKIDQLTTQEWVNFKRSLATKNKIENRPLIKCINGDVPTEIILGFHDTNETRDKQLKPIDHTFKTFSGHIDAMPSETLRMHIMSLAPNLIRAKGITQDADGPYVFNFAGERWAVERAPKTIPSGHFILIGFSDLSVEKTIFKPYTVVEHQH